MGVNQPGGHGGALLAGLLAEHGVRHVFGVPGGQTLALYDAILDRAPALSHVLVRDERTAAYAADGYARMTGRVGVCDATVGPGAAKLPSGLGEALGASVPVIALVSDLPTRLAAHRYRSAASQALDQAALLAPVTKWLASVPDAVSMPGLVRQAFRAATSGRPGPVALLLPQDVLDAPAEPVPPRAASARFGTFPAFRPAPEPADVAAVAQVLRRAARPFLLAGGGVMHSGAGPAVTALAARLSAAVGTTLTGKGAIAEDHPLSVGVTGTMGTAAAAAALAEADVVLLAGTKASGGATYGWALPHAGQQVVQLDIDPAELGRAFEAVAAMLGDARAGLTALLAELGTGVPADAVAGAAGPGGPGAAGAGPASGAEPDRSTWRARLALLTANWRAVRDTERASDAIPIAPQRVLAALEQALAPGDCLICDASLASGWGGVYFEQRQPGRQVLFPRGQAGLGYALPAAIGAATAAVSAAATVSGRTVVLTGDGALGYALGELATVTQLGLPITVVVLNNRSLGWIRWYQRITFGRGYADDDFADVAYADVAGAFGMHGVRVTDPAELGAAMASAVRSDRPALVDVVTEMWETPIGAHRSAVAQGATAGYGGLRPMPRHPDRQLERLTQPVAAQLLAASGTAVVAVGSVEQHGGHLPLGTDAFAAQSIAERVAVRLDTVVAPLGPVGVAPYHLPWPGSLSLSPSTLTAVLVDVCAALAQAGVSRIVLVNWHEGNSPTLRLAAAEVQQRHGLRVLIAETHVITHSLYPDEMEFTHAGAMETAAVLAYEPGLVHLDQAGPASDLASGETAHELFRQRDVYPVLQDFHDIAPTGWYGRPERADQGRAEEIAEAVADHVVRRVREIWAQLADRDGPVPPGQVPPGHDGLSAAAAGAQR